MARGQSGAINGATPLTSSLLGPAKRFFQKSLGAKVVFQGPPGNAERGYYAAAAERPEHFSVVLGGGSTAEDAPDLQAKAEIALAATVADARDILTSLGWSLSSAHSDQFARLMDSRPLPDGVFSASLLRMIAYHAASSGLVDHVDRGLLTFVAQSPGANGDGDLEVFDQREQEWVRPPIGAIVLFAGHTLEAASAGVFQAARHRVATVQSSDASDEGRLSLVFQVRARADAIIDFSSSVPRGIRRGANVECGITSSELMCRFAATHSSVGGHNTISRLEPQPKRARAEDPPLSESELADLNRVIRIRLIDMSGHETLCTLKRSTRMGKVFGAYVKSRGSSINELRFLINGVLIGFEMTAAHLQLEDQDQIDVAKAQKGD